MEKALMKVVKVSSNDTVPMIYLPKDIRELLGLKKGTYVVLRVEGQRLIVERLDVHLGRRAT